MKALVKVPTQRKKEKSASLMAIKKPSKNKEDNTELSEKKEELNININRIRKTDKLLGNEVIDSFSDSVKAPNCLFCRGTRRNAQCPKHNAVDKGKKRAKELKLCFKC